MSRTVASNPAGVSVQLGHFLKSDGKDLIILVVALALGAALLAVNWKPAAIVAGIGTFVFLFSALSAKDIFKSGDVCPAVVVDSDRQLVAVMTDLAQGGKSLPVVKVLAQPLRRAVQGPVKKGTRLAFVAMYAGQPGQRAWNNFGGYLINTGTSNQKAIQRVLASISDAEWSRLMTAVKGLETPYRTGLFDVRARPASGDESGGAKLVARPSPFRVRPAFAIAAGVVAAPILLMVVMAVFAKMNAGGGVPLPPNPQQIAQGGAPAPLDPADVAPGPFPPPFPPGVNHRGAPQGQPLAIDQRQPQGAAATEPGAPPADAGENPFRPVDAGGAPADDNAANPFRPVDAGEAPAGDDESNPFRPAAPRNAGGQPPPQWRPGMIAETERDGRWRPVAILRIVSPTEVEVRWLPGGPEPPQVLPISGLRQPQGREVRQAPTGATPPASAQPADAAGGQFRVGQKAEASWANRWLPVTILAVQPDGQLQIHWEGYSDAFDEVVPASRLRPATAAPR